MGVEHPYVKECVLPLLSTKPLHSNVQSCTVFSVCRSEGQDLSCQWLKFRLYPHIGVHLSGQHCSKVPNLIVPQKSEPSMRTGECMLHIELASAAAPVRKRFWCPSVSQADCIVKGSLMQVESMFVCWQGLKPVGCSLLSSQVPHPLQL